MWAEVDGERKKVAWYVISLFFAFSYSPCFRTSTMGTVHCTKDTFARFILSPSALQLLNDHTRHILVHAFDMVWLAVVGNIRHIARSDDISPIQLIHCQP
jgi:hypothetical protein